MNIHTSHIIRFQADISSISDGTDQVASSDYNSAIGFLSKHGESLSSVTHGGGVFLLPHLGLLQFFRECRLHHPKFQIEVFSLLPSEQQLIPPTDGEPKHLSVERFRVPRAS